MKVRIKLLEEALGSSPSNEDLMGTYIASKAPTADLTSEEIDNIKAQNAEDRITVFPKQADGTPFIYDYQIKGMLKDSCKALAAAGKAGYPGGKACAGLKAYKKAIDGLITNFHLPESTLIMLIAAFYGYDKTMAAYKVAVEEKYRFFSFGDAMFIR